MEKDSTKPSISIPKANEDEVVNIPPGKGGINSSVNQRLDKIDQVLYGVMLAVVLSMIAIIVSVIGLFLDQMRYNNAAYKDYSQKVQSVTETQDMNQFLLEQDEKNQQVILEKQKQITDLQQKLSASESNKK